MNKTQEYMRSRRWGVFNHFLYDKPGSDMPMGEDQWDWNERVEMFDVERVAKDLYDVGAGYYFITIMQGRKYMIAPNAAFDEIAGTKPGEACAKRDLIADLLTALKKYDIPLCLYFTGDGPYKDEEIGEKFGFVNPRTNISMDFCQRWGAVLEEYAVRYGDNIKAWWVDGCYTYFGYDFEKVAVYYDAIKKGAPNALACMNMANGDGRYLYKAYERDEFTPGEFIDFTVVPQTPMIDGALPHILAPLGKSADGNPWGGWGEAGTIHDNAYMKDYVHRVNEAGGIVSVDIQIRYDSTFDADQLDVIRGL